ATNRTRPHGQTLEQLVQYARARNAHVQLMADIATVEEAVYAQQLGFDCVSTTLYGYTAATEGKKLYEYDFQFLKDVLVAVSIPVIAEGNVITPEMSRRCLELGAYSVVVGGAITRPHEITRRFVGVMRGNA